eukprot:gnl/Dysnectes_brevis/870_a963_4167.p1 GENE.gnl/Dysnectes_brevis/870_a963_4167~~gnl/Dysnectes_brevis/870_a963_4167.p1  ORF type:complete len:803 (-),score=339.58 gnl/Dysnectes_brevis/870_a963_4167:72-2480(-)
MSQLIDFIQNGDDTQTVQLLQQMEHDNSPLPQSEKLEFYHSTIYKAVIGGFTVIRVVNIIGKDLVVWPELADGSRFWSSKAAFPAFKQDDKTGMVVPAGDAATAVFQGTDVAVKVNLDVSNHKSSKHDWSLFETNPIDLQSALDSGASAMAAMAAHAGPPKGSKLIDTRKLQTPSHLLYHVTSKVTAPLGIKYTFSGRGWAPYIAAEMGQLSHDIRANTFTISMILPVGGSAVLGVLFRPGGWSMRYTMNMRSPASPGSLGILRLPAVPEKEFDWAAVLESVPRSALMQSGPDNVVRPPMVLFDKDPLPLVQRTCQQHGIKFTSPYFKPDATCVYKPEIKHDAARFKKLGQDIDFARMRDVHPHAELFVSSEGECIIHAKDINQGALGSCWLLSAIASCADSDPYLIYNIFSPRRVEDPTYGNCGAFTIRLYLNNKWRWILVDDFVAIDSSSRNPVFATSTDPREFWVTILEKAFASVVGCYQGIIGSLQGRRSPLGTYTSMIALTGCTRIIRHEVKSVEGVVKVIKEHRLDEESRFVMTCGTDGAKVGSSGLTPDHQYTIMSLNMKTNPHAPMGFIQLRNPWSTTKFNGDWSDGSSLWKKYPAFEEELQPFADDSGSFWMSIRDFVNYFDHLALCGPRNSFHSTLKAFKDFMVPSPLHVLADFYWAGGSSVTPEQYSSLMPRSVEYIRKLAAADKWSTDKDTIRPQLRGTSGGIVESRTIGFFRMGMAIWFKATRDLTMTIKFSTLENYGLLSMKDPSLTSESDEIMMKLEGGEEAVLFLMQKGWGVSGRFSYSKSFRYRQ